MPLTDTGKLRYVRFDSIPGYDIGYVPSLQLAIVAMGILYPTMDHVNRKSRVRKNRISIIEYKELDGGVLKCRVQIKGRESSDRWYTTKPKPHRHLRSTALSLLTTILKQYGLRDDRRDPPEDLLVEDIIPAMPTHDPITLAIKAPLRIARAIQSYGYDALPKIDVLSVITPPSVKISEIYTSGQATLGASEYTLEARDILFTKAHQSGKTGNPKLLVLWDLYRRGKRIRTWNTGVDKEADMLSWSQSKEYIHDALTEAHRQLYHDRSKLV